MKKFYCVLWNEDYGVFGKGVVTEPKFETFVLAFFYAPALFELVRTLEFAVNDILFAALSR